MELTEKEQQKIHQNESENNVYKVQLDKFFNKQMPTHEIINVCSTPNILKIFNSTAKKVVLSQKDLQNAVSAADLGNKGHREGHDIAKSEIYKLPESIRSPILMLKGNSRNSNSVVMLTEMINKKGENVFVPIALDRQKGKISNISTLYGKKNLSQYLSDHLSDILAINIKKADMLANIGVQFPKSIYDTVVCFDDSISYSMANVKYISENFQNFSEKGKTSNEETERNDNMAEISQQELLERIAALESQVKAMSDEQQSLKEQIATVNQFVSAITESQNFEQSMSTIESMGKQVLDCGKAEFWCYDGAENKYFSNDENRGGRDWQIAKENMRIAAETKEAHIADGEAYIPIISNDKVAGILVASEKDGMFDKASIDKFAPNGQIANTIDLSLKKEFEHQGRITDELTRLKNRQGAKEYAANTMAHNVNAEKDMCLIMCDIDHFKSINDTYGHDAGDTVLKNVAGILQSGTRQGADSAFRWGGEEMVCVLNCDYDHAMDIAERLRQQIESTTHLVYNADKEPTNVSVTISMGVYQVKPDKEITQENAFSFFESQLKFADELAYKAKETGRNKVVGESDIMYEKNAENAIETAQEVITAGTIEKYGLDVDFKNINEIVLTTATENYIGGIDNDGHERRDNYELAENGVEIYYSEYHNGGSLVRLESENPFFDMTITIDEALEEIQNFLDEAWNDRDKSIIIKYNDGRKEYIDPNKLLEEKTRAEESYSIFRVEKGDGFAFFRDNNTDINTLMQRYVDCHNDNNLINYDEFLKDCTEISEVVAAELEQLGNPPPAFCAEITIDENELRVWDDEKIATINLDEAIQSIKDNGTVNLDYQKFAENNDTVELTSEYLDFSVNLDNAYDDFMYHSSIYNNEYIEFVDNHGQLPYDLNTAENRDIVTEYINIQLESGSNLSESQKETLIELKNQIDEIKEMESKLGIDEGDLKFIAETKSMVAWTDEAMKTLDERNAGRDEQGRDDPF